VIRAGQRVMSEEGSNEVIRRGDAGGESRGEKTSTFRPAVQGVEVRTIGQPHKENCPRSPTITILEGGDERRLRKERRQKNGIQR